jgi:hypothetical protein
MAPVLERKSNGPDGKTVVGFDFTNPGAYSGTYLLKPYISRPTPV